MVHSNNNTSYYINPAHLTFVENSGYGANLIQVSASSSCYIRVFIPGEIGYDSEGNYRRWKIIAYNNKFPDNDAFYIYARLERNGYSALIVYSKVLYNVDGSSVNGSIEASDTYYYIKLGDVTATDGTSIREITYDTGRLESDQVKNEGSELNEMWELDRYSSPWLIKAKQWLSSFTIKGILTLIGGLIFKKDEVEKPVVDLKRSMDSDFEYIYNEDGSVKTDENGFPIKDETYVPISDDTIPTTKYVKTMNDDRYILKIRPDQTEFLVKFLDGLEAGLHEDGGVDGSKLYSDGRAELGRLQVNGNSEFRGDLSSKEFISGFTAGKGWAIRLKEYLNSAGVTEHRSVAEFDDLIVRGTLRVFEFVVSQMLGENDNRTFTAMLEVDHYDPETGRVWLDTRDGTFYNPFRKDDVVIVQQFNGMPSEENGYYMTKQYELIVEDVGIGDMSLKEERLDWLTFRDFTSPMEDATTDLIQKGDTFVRIDNLTDPTRKGIIQLMTVGEDTPYMDIIYGRKTDPDNSLKGRFGNIQGVYNPLFGWLREFGAYLTNLYAVGEFRIAHTGEDVADALEISSGQFRTSYSQTTYDMTEADNFFTNASMTNSCESWVLSEEQTEYFTVGDDLEFFNYEPYVNEESFAGVSEHKGRDMLRLYKGYVYQTNDLIRKPGTHKVYDPNSTGGGYEDVPDTIYLSIRVHVTDSGVFECGFASENGVFYDNPFHVIREYEAQEDAYDIRVSGTWDGLGDFWIKSSGDMYIDMLSLTDDTLDNFKITTSTKIEQDAKHIALLGQKVNGVESSVTDLGIELNAAEERITLYVDKEINGVETSISELEIAVDEIRASVGKIELDSAGNVVNISKSGLVLTADYASLFSTEVNKQGVAKTSQLDAYVLETELGSLVSKIEISADQIDLTGVVTYSMLNGSLANKLDAKAENKDLIEANNKLNQSIANLTSTLESVQTEVGKKASIESLNDKVNVLNNALKGKADTDLENAVINAAVGGSTLIVNGYINADLIDVSKLVVRDVTTNEDDYGNTMLLADGGLEMRNSKGELLASIQSGTYGSGLTLRNTSGDVLSLYPTDISYRPSSGKNVYFNSTFGIELFHGSTVAGFALGRIQTYMSADADFCVLSNGAELPSPSQWKGKMIWIYAKVSATIHGTIFRSDGVSATSVGVHGMNFFISDGTYWYHGYCQ